MEAEQSGRERLFPCESCGASLAFDIGSQALECPYCGFAKAIDLREDAEIREQDLLATLESQVAQRSDEAEPAPAEREVACGACGANVILAGNVTAQDCAYCGVPIQAEVQQGAGGRIPVDAMLPFRVARTRAREVVGKWLSGLWFAPNAFMASDVPDRLRGVYVPYWTFDARTFSRYRGERGTAYYVTVRRNGKSQRVRRIRWSAASGSFQHAFDDEPVAGDAGLPREIVRELEPWPFEQCVSFRSELLAGHVAKTYDVPLAEGFKIARSRMEEHLLERAKRDIGGDAQRIHDISTRWDALTYKHVLLPIWMLAVRYQDQAYRLYVNATTGEVQGERPYSKWKIAAAALAAAALLALAVDQEWIRITFSL